MTPPFKDNRTLFRWNAYFAEVDRMLRPMGHSRGELRSDLEAHLSDSFASGDPEVSEDARLAVAISRLGQPADYLKALIADELIEQGTRTFHPAPIVRGLYYSLGLDLGRTAVAASFGLGYLLLGIFVAMALLKPVWGNHVGLFRRSDGAVSFGIISNPAGMHELLGYWIIPIVLIIAVLLYAVLTRALRAVRAK